MVGACGTNVAGMKCRSCGDYSHGFGALLHMSLRYLLHHCMRGNVDSQSFKSSLKPGCALFVYGVWFRSVLYVLGETVAIDVIEGYLTQRTKTKVVKKR
eukprot:4868214-Amphidinium_carterae.1